MGSGSAAHGQAVKPRLLDLFCGAGGCAKGYQRAGFYVVGVDIKAQPNYCGDEFHQGDALAFLEQLIGGHGGEGACGGSDPVQVARGEGKEIWSVDLIGSVTGRVRHSPERFPSKGEAERHGYAKLGSPLD